MIKIDKKEECCGCNACGDVCPQGAISFKRDVGEFLYPEVDEAKCTHCGLCEKVCPMLHVDEVRNANERKFPEAHAAISTNMQLRFESTSGGMFSTFAEKVLAEGGFVGGAVWDGEWFVHQIVSDDPHDLPRMRCSKYAQSDARGFFKSVKSAVDSGRQTLVCGTPCQMVALRLYLGRDYDNLIILDFICRTVPAPLAIRRYVRFVEEKCNSRAVAMQMKNKEFGWRSLTTKFTLENGGLYYDEGSWSPFMRGFVGKDLLSRESCYQCKFRGFPRVADVTVGDCWGVVDRLEGELNDNLGTSIVLCNTTKGGEFFSDICQGGKLKTVRLEEGDVLNPVNIGLYKSPVCEKEKREQFLQSVKDNGFDVSSVPNVTQFGCLRKVRHFLGSIKRTVQRIFTHRKNLCLFVKINGWHKLVFGGPAVIPVGNVLWQQDKTARLNVKGDLWFGRSLFNGSSLETRMLMMPQSELSVHGGGFFFGSNIELFAGGKLKIGHHFHANINCTINCGESIKIGNHVSLGRRVSIRDTHGHWVGTPGFKKSRPVEIGDHVWIASEAMIMPGVHIGSGAVIGARSLVLHDVPPNTLVVGSPAHVVHENIQFRMR